VNAVAEQRAAVTVALLGPADAARQQLRQALQGFGAELIFEGELAEAGQLAGRGGTPAVLIVNLEPGVEDELDSIQELLDHPDTCVVFNEGEVSSQLTGWDLARWARHLAAKVLGVRDTLPPAPSGAERLPVLDLVPEPGRPASPAQQQDHLQFDTFADEVFSRQDEVPTSPRLDQTPAPESAPAVALDFDFSPVASADHAMGFAVEDKTVAPVEDRLDDMDLSSVFEQDFDQLSPEDLLARLQIAMGLDPVRLPEDGPRSSAHRLRPRDEPAEITPDQPPVAVDRGEPADVSARDRETSASLDSLSLDSPPLDRAERAISATAAGEEAAELVGSDAEDMELELASFDFESASDDDDQAPENHPTARPAPAELSQLDLSTDNLTRQEPSAEASSGFSFDPVSAEYDTAVERSEAAFDESFATPAGSRRGSDERSVERDEYAFEFDFERGGSSAEDDTLEVSLGSDLKLEDDPGLPSEEPPGHELREACFDKAELDEPGLDRSGFNRPGLDRPGFDLQDASLGGTLTLDSGADDDEIARMSDALDAQHSGRPPRELPELEFDFSRPRFELEPEGEEPTAAASAEATPPSREPTAGRTPQAAQERSSFGELELTPMSDDFIDPQVAAPLAEPPRLSFDFSSLSLSLEPLNEDSGNAADSAAASPAEGSSVAAMRDGVWLRDIGDEAPATVADAEQASAAFSEAAPLHDEESATVVHVAPPPSVAPPLSEGVSRVVVLCASIGGPDALRSFLGGIPPGFPAVFLVVQHLESGYFERLAQQLQKASKLPVKVPASGQTTRDGEVLVVSSENRFLLSVAGEVELTDKQSSSRYQPCIDDVLGDVSEAFGANATAIIFSGMAADAIEGAVGLTQLGGEVWVQDPESCVVSSMVDGARARGVVEFIGSPRELAEHCVRRFGA